MKKNRLNQIILLSTICLVSILYWKSILDVPFHPDEATQIFMSQDIDLIFNGKWGDLAFSQTPQSSTAQHYHLVDPPFTRYCIGIARLLFHSPALRNDWNWKLSWEENETNGALPSSAQLLLTRTSIFIFFPFCLLFCYLISATLSNNTTGWIALILFSTNSLLILHTHRAMTEGPLVFWILFSLWLMISRPKYFLLSAIPVAFAINTKLTAAALLPVLFMLPIYFSPTILKKIIYFIFTSAVLLGFSFALNPIYWNNPIKVLGTAITERSKLMTLQTESLSRINPEKILASPIEKIAGTLGNLFFQPPAISDIDNYDKELQEQKNNYLNNPFHTISQKPYFAIPFLITSISGFLLACLLFLRRVFRYRFSIILFGFISQICVILIVVDLPFQRYILPAIPYCIMFSALFISSFIKQKPRPK